MKKFFEFLGIPKFNTYEEFLSSSWFAVRVATLTVGIIAFQSMKVIQTFSLYEGTVVIVHSLLWTTVTALAILHFTIKLSKLGEDDKKMKKLIGRLIMLFSFIEFLLGVGYHTLWFNQQAGLTEFTIPELTPGFIYTIFLDMLLPATLYFYGHTVHIKTKAELNLIEEPKKINLQSGDAIVVEVDNLGERKLKIKEVQFGPQEPSPDKSV